MKNRDFPGSPVAKARHSQCGGLCSIPGQGTRSHTPKSLHPTPEIFHCCKEGQRHSVLCWFNFLESVKVEKKKMLNLRVSPSRLFPNIQECDISLWWSVSQFSRSVMSDSLRPHESQHTRPPCPSPTPRVYPNSRPLSQWCHPAISSSVVPFSSCPQSLPASESFPMSQLFAWGGQSIGVSAFSISPSKEHPGLFSFRMDWLDLLAAQGTLKSLLHHHSSKASILWHSAFLQSNSHIHTWPLEKP